MSRVLRSPGLARFLILTAIGLVPVGFSLLTPSPCLAHPFASQAYGGQDPGGQDMPNPFGQFPGDDDMMPRRGTRTKAARKKLQSATKGTAKKADTTTKTKKAATKNDGGNVVNSSSHKTLRRFSWPIASTAIAETKPEFVAVSSI